MTGVSDSTVIASAVISLCASQALDKNLFSALIVVAMSSNDVIACIRRLTARQERVAVTMQALWRGAAARRSFLRMRAAATTVQVLVMLGSLTIAGVPSQYQE